MIDDMVLFDGYIPSSSSTKRPKIVSSAYWDVFVWDYYDGGFLQYHQYCGLLTAVVTPFEEPYVVGVSDKERLITFNPFATSASKTAFQVKNKGHEPKNKVKYDSIVVSINHYVRQNRVVVVTGTYHLLSCLPVNVVICAFANSRSDMQSTYVFTIRYVTVSNYFRS